MTAERADFGGRLRAAREARGLSLKDIAAATKISPLTLEALERNDARRLPGGLFSRAFVRAYAREVGLDPEQTVRDFVERFSDQFDFSQAEPVRMRPLDDEIEPGASRTGLRWLGLAVMIALVIGWIALDRYYSARVDQAPRAARSTTSDAPQPPAAPRLPAAPPAAPPPLEAPQPSARTMTTAAPPAAATTAPPAGQPQPPAPSPTEAGQPPAAEQQPAAETPATEMPAYDANAPLRVVVSPTASCWLSVRVDGKRVAGRTVHAGQTVQLSAGREIVLTAGDAAAVSYTVNNAPGRALGAAGQVVTVVINTDNYRTFVAGRQ